MAKQIRLALVMAGGVSLGSFSAGALVETLRAYLAKARLENAKLTIDVVAGASAGSICLAQMVFFLRAVNINKIKGEALAESKVLGFQSEDEKKDWVKKMWKPMSLEDKQLEYLRIKLAETWVFEMSFDKLITPQLAAPTVADPAAIEGIVMRTLAEFNQASNDSKTQESSIIDPRCSITFTVNNLIGIGTRTKSESVFDVNTADGVSSVEHGDKVTFVVSPEDVTRGTSLVNLDDITSICDFFAVGVASSSFPFAFPPVRLNRKRAGFSAQLHDRSEFLKGDDSEELPFTYGDGGIFDNEPLVFSLQQAQKKDSEDRKQGEKVERHIVLIDANVSSADQTVKIINGLHFPISETGLAAMGSTLVGSVLDQASRKDAAVVDCKDSVRAVAPKPEQRLAGAFLGNLGGFLHETFRRHDFYAGQSAVSALISKLSADSEKLKTEMYGRADAPPFITELSAMKIDYGQLLKEDNSSLQKFLERIENMIRMGMFAVENIEVDFGITWTTPDTLSSLLYKIAFRVMKKKILSSLPKGILNFTKIDVHLSIKCTQDHQLCLVRQNGDVYLDSATELGFQDVISKTTTIRTHVYVDNEKRIVDGPFVWDKPSQDKSVQSAPYLRVQDNAQYIRSIVSMMDIMNIPLPESISDSQSANNTITATVQWTPKSGKAMVNWEESTTSDESTVHLFIGVQSKSQHRFEVKGFGVFHMQPADAKSTLFKAFLVLPVSENDIKNSKGPIVKPYPGGTQYLELKIVDTMTMALVRNFRSSLQTVHIELVKTKQLKTSKSFQSTIDLDAFSQPTAKASPDWNPWKPLPQVKLAGLQHLPVIARIAVKSSGSQSRMFRLKGPNGVGPRLLPYKVNVDGNIAMYTFLDTLIYVHVGSDGRNRENTRVTVVKGEYFQGASFCFTDLGTVKDRNTDVGVPHEKVLRDAIRNSVPSPEVKQDDNSGATLACIPMVECEVDVGRGILAATVGPWKALGYKDENARYFSALAQRLKTKLPPA